MNGTLPAPSDLPGPLPLFRLLRAILSNPLDMWSREHFETPVVVTRTVLGSRVVVSDPGAIRRILIDNAANYVRDDIQQRILRRTTGRSLFSAEGAEWRLQRRALAPFFSADALAGYLPGMLAAANHLVARLGAISGPVELDRDLGAATVDVLGRTILAGALGEPTADISASLRRFAGATGAVGLGDLIGLPAWLPAFRPLLAWPVLRQVRNRARRIAAAGDCPLVTALRAARDPETGCSLSRREIEDNISTLIGAGSDTLAAALTWSVFLLGQSPASRAAVEAEVDGLAIQPDSLGRLAWTQAVVEEAMRLYPPAPLIGRMAVAEDVLAGQRFAAGTVFLIAPWVVHRHARLWSEPNAFQPERFLPGQRANIPRGAYLPFGAGPRTCIGMGFAMQAALVLLARLVQELRFERADERPVRLRQCVTLQPRDGLWMRVVRR